MKHYQFVSKARVVIRLVFCVAHLFINKSKWKRTAAFSLGQIAMLLGDTAFAMALTARQSLNCLGKGFIQGRSVNKDPASVYQSMNGQGRSVFFQRLCYGICVCTV
jgi:hypothetical protein